MNLTNDQQLQLTALCNALTDDTVSANERERLNAMLRDSEDARRFYVRHAALSASLGEYAAEMQSEAPALPKHRAAWVRALPWAAAATVLIMGLVMMHHEEETTQSTLFDQSDQSHPSVAALSGTKDCEWSSEAMQTGASLQAGQRVSLKSGVAEITFDSGAQVTVEGPASLVVASAWDASLESGSANASVPAEAEGFRLSNNSVELVNSDAELSMIADPTSTEVLVRKGSVSASSRASVALRSAASGRGPAPPVACRAARTPPACSPRGFAVRWR